jgi:hypothetical protein
MTFSPAPSNPLTTYSVRGIARRSTGEVFVTLNDGEVYRSAAGSETLTRLTNLPTQTASTLLGPVVAVGGDVLLTRGATVLACAGACTDFNDFAPVHTLAFPEAPAALCADANAAYLTSNSGSTGKLGRLRRSGAVMFDELSANLGVGRVEKCQVTPAGDVVVAAETVAVLRSTGGVASETVDLQGQPGASWRDVAVRGNTGFLVGGGNGYRVAQRTGSAWTSVLPDTSGTVLTSIVLLSESEVLAGGIANSGSSSAPGILRWNGSRFVALTPTAPVFEVELAVTVSADEVYFAGYERSSGGYVIVHGTR